MRALTKKYGTLLINDETHTFSAGPGGATRAWGLAPDMLTIGKAIAGGIPIGAYGMSKERADHLECRADLDMVDVAGVGGTLSGHPVSSGAVRATRAHGLTRSGGALMGAVGSVDCGARAQWVRPGGDTSA